MSTPKVVQDANLIGLISANLAPSSPIQLSSSGYDSAIPTGWTVHPKVDKISCRVDGCLVVDRGRRDKHYFFMMVFEIERRNITLSLSLAHGFTIRGYGG